MMAEFFAKRTGRLVVIHEAVKRGGYGAEIQAVVSEKACDYLDAPIKRIAAANTPVPFAPTLENFVIPDERDIIKKVKELFG